jgi:hypothetical protein
VEATNKMIIMRHLTIDSSFIPVNKDEICFELAYNIIVFYLFKRFFVKYNGVLKSTNTIIKLIIL